MLSKKLFMNSKDHDLHELGAGFFLHDIGKLRVDSAIINKAGKLTDEEMQKMRTQSPSMLPLIVQCRFDLFFCDKYGGLSAGNKSGWNNNI